MKKPFFSSALCLVPSSWLGLLSYKGRLWGEGAWVFFGQTGSAIGLLVGTRLLTEFVPPETFGTVNLLLGLNALGFNLFCLPPLQAALRFYPEAAEKGQTPRLRQTVGIMLGRASGLLAAAILLAGVAAAYWGDYSYGTFLALAGLVVAEVFRMFEWNLLGAARRQKVYALWTLAESWARPLLAVLAVLLFGTAAEVVVAGYLAATVGGLLIYRLVGPGQAVRSVPLGEDTDDLAGQIRRYAWPLVPLSLVAWVGGVSDRYIIGGLVGVEATGVYSATYGLISRPFLMLNGTIELLLRPIYFQAVATGDRRGETNILRAWMGLTAGAAALGALLVTLFQQTIADLFFGPQYRAGAALMPWIAVGYAFLIVSMVCEKPSYAHKRTMWVTVIQASGALLSVVLGLPLVYYWGIQGAAAAVPIYFGVQLLVALAAKAKVENERPGGKQ